MLRFTKTKFKTYKLSQTDWQPRTNIVRWNEYLPSLSYCLLGILRDKDYHPEYVKIQIKELKHFLFL